MLKKLLVCALLGLRSIAFGSGQITFSRPHQEAVIVECCECEEEHCSHIPIENVYQNHCWRCGSSINSNVNRRCGKCGWYICNNCGACDSDCPRCPAWKNNNYSGSSSSSNEKSDNSWVWFLIIGGVVVAGIVLYKKYQN